MLIDIELVATWLVLTVFSAVVVHIVIESFRSMFSRRRYPWDPKP